MVEVDRVLNVLETVFSVFVYVCSHVCMYGYICVAYTLRVTTTTTTTRPRSSQLLPKFLTREYLWL